MPHCEDKGVVTWCHPICKGCLWAGSPFYKCPICRKKIYLPTNALHDLMLAHCPEILVLVRFALGKRDAGDLPV